MKCDKDFLSILPEQFVSSYLLDMCVMHAVAGFDFSYGHRAAGHIDRLKRDSSNRIDVTKVAKIEFQRKKISSTWIRELILKGEMKLLSNILGRKYETEVYWDGECFQLSPYYMLPAQGLYKVALIMQGIRQEIEVFIPTNQDGIYLTEKRKHRFLPNGKCNMIWLHQVRHAQKLHAESASILQIKG
nr:hypothetical protein [Oceanobacillus salinisoli]